MQRVFSQILQLVVSAGSRVILLLDEYQRVQSHNGATRDALNAVFLDAFNSIPRHFSIVFSCSTAGTGFPITETRP
jgi:ERCC4-type nuclease